MIHYYLRPTNNNHDPKKSFDKILEYLISFVGDIEVKKENDTTAIIYYIGTPTTAHLKLEKAGQITVIISADDNVTINLINNTAQGIGYRVYNSQINCYLPNDVNIYDLTTIKIDTSIKNVLNLYQLTPLFQLRNSLIFFCKNQKDEIVLVNRHLLEYLITNHQSLITNEFSVVIAPNIAVFIALYDRGLVSLTNPNSKIINLSGFDIYKHSLLLRSKLPKDTKLNIINFSYDEENQSFIQQDTANKIPKRYLALKVGQDYTYSMVGTKLIKILNVSVFN